MDQIGPTDSTAKKLILLLLERLQHLDEFVHELDRSQEALMKALLDIRPELAESLSRSFLRHMNALKNSSEIATPDRSGERSAVYGEVIRRLKEM